MVAPTLERPSQPKDAPSGRAKVLPLTPAPSDAGTIVRGLREGDAAAFCQLYDRYAKMVRGLLLRVMGSGQGVEDLTHDVFLTVVRRCDEIRKPESLHAFVYGVAVRSAKDELRRRKLRRWIGWGDTPAAALPTVSQDPAVRESVAHIYEALEQLPVDCRLAFTLRHIEGMELSEAAEACGWSLSTFKRRIVKAERQFDAIASHDPVLRAVMAERKGRS